MGRPLASESDARSTSRACPPSPPKAKSRQGKQRKEKEDEEELADAIKGMQVRSWEVRGRSSGRRVVYVRFEEKRPAFMVNVKES